MTTRSVGTVSDMFKGEHLQCDHTILGPKIRHLKQFSLPLHELIPLF